MTIVVGQIEPLKKLKVILNENGITRFNSIGEINTFINNYEAEKKEIPKIIESKLNQEINNLQSALTKHQHLLDHLLIEMKMVPYLLVYRPGPFHWLLPAPKS